MSDRPILFSAPMVRALLDGRKTQTRRILKPQPGPCDHTPWAQGTSEFQPSIDEDGVHCAQCGNGVQIARTKSGVRGIPVRFAKGDRIWVREMHQFRGADYGDSDGEIEWFRCYGSGGASDNWDPTFPDGWEPSLADAVRKLTAPDEQEPGATGYVTKRRPGIHMPRWASRLTLTVSDVRVERLTDISEVDALAEGIIRYGGDEFDDAEFSMAEGGDIYSSAVEAYEALWNRINGALAWRANPWVVAVTFAVDRRNIDEVAEQVRPLSGTPAP